MRQVVAILREVPIWTFGPLYDVFGRYTGEGWSQDPFMTMTVEEAERFLGRPVVT